MNLTRLLPINILYQLYLNDDAKTPVTRFYQYHMRIGMFLKGWKASLEIFPAGEHIGDIILVTFVYIKQLWKMRKEAAQHAGGG
jgi:hypothetical protein